MAQRNQPTNQTSKKPHQIRPLTLGTNHLDAESRDSSVVTLDAEDQEFADTFAEDLFSSEEFSYDRGAAECIAAGYVQEIGVGPLQEAGLTGEKAVTTGIDDIHLKEDEKLEVVDVLFDCVDDKELLLADGVTENQATCVLNRIGVETFKERDVADISDDSETAKKLEEEINEAFDKC